MTQYKLLILKTVRQITGKSWLHYDVAFRKNGVASGAVNWSRMNNDVYNYHTQASPQPQPSQHPLLGLTEAHTPYLERQPS